MKIHCFLRAALAATAATIISGSASAAPFRVFMIHSTATDHIAMSTMARTVLADMGKTNDFTIDSTTDNTLINETNLANYDVFLSMHLAPFEFEMNQRAAFENFIKSGKGWVGIHAAGLVMPTEYKERRQQPWPFYDMDLMGGVTYVTHPPKQSGVVLIDDRTHPLMRNIPASYRILDEWYEWSGNPRSNVHVLGRADESTYTQVKPAGDHPLMWTIDKYQRAIYIQLGHDVTVWQNPTYNILVRDALLWAAKRLGPTPDGGTDAPDAGGGTGGQATGGSGSGGARPVMPPLSSRGCSCGLHDQTGGAAWLPIVIGAIVTGFAARRRRRLP